MKRTSRQPAAHVILRTLTAAAVLVASASAWAGSAPTLTEEQKPFYAIGASVAKSLEVFDLTPAEFELVKQGLADVQAGKTKDFDLTQLTPKIQELAKARRKAAGEKQVATGKEFLEKAAKEKGAVKTASGMVFQTITEGKGDAPKAADLVKVNYRGTLADGREFDSSYRRGKPLEFKLDNVIKCWVEGVQMMKPGGKAKLVCPANLAYGDNGAGEMILPGATLAFEVELIEVKSGATAAAASVPAKK